jgi:hypothetical protein
MTQTPKPQTKFNAKRSADAATRRTGIEHSIAEVEGGWMVVAPQSAAENEPPTAEIEETTQAEASAIADEIDAGQVKPPGSPPRVPRGLAAAAQAVLDAWNDETNREIDMIGALEGPMAALSIALAGKPERSAGAPRPPREGTKQQAVLALLRRDEGATIAQIMEATAWQSHTVRGFLAGLKKKGTQVDVLDRIRQVGPNKEGAKGSYSIYRIVG